MADFKKGDKVTCSAEYNYTGTTHLASFVRTNTYEVIEAKGDRIVIGINGKVTAAVNANTLNNLSASPEPAPVQTPEVPAVNQDNQQQESTMTSQQLDEALMRLMASSGNGNDPYKHNMRLFGLPYQFTPYCDFRTYSYMSSKPSFFPIGRKFTENIMLEAPVVTIIPGKPDYLPADKNAIGTSTTLLQAATSPFEKVIEKVQTEIDEKTIHEKLRYYDFKQDYLNYMMYVNILCSTAAVYLELGDIELDGVPLMKYKWQNYRWNADNYRSVVSNMMGASKDFLSGLGEAVKSFGEDAVDAVLGNNKKNDDRDITPLYDTTDKDLMAALEDIMTQTNFVQFYINANSGVSEGNTNSTSPSKLQSMFDSGAELAKEIAFLANSGGVDASAIQEETSGAVDAMNERLFNGNGVMSGVMSRLMSSTSNIIKGEKLVFPEIYQDSNYSKSYNIEIDLRAPQGNRLGYYLNILVPLFHLMALAIPKQTTANTFGSPFLIRAYLPGVFSCNLGIVDSITIDKNLSGGGWTVDGYPNEVKVTLSLKDLYSDMSITPAGDPLLFLANSSLIEYIATNCGVNLATPQLINRVNYSINAIKGAFSAVAEGIAMEVFNPLINAAQGLIGA